MYNFLIKSFQTWAAYAITGAIDAGISYAVGSYVVHALKVIGILKDFTLSAHVYIYIYDWNYFCFIF